MLAQLEVDSQEVGYDPIIASEQVSGRWSSDRIAELTGCDVGQASGALHLMVALRAHDLLSGASSTGVQNS